MLPEYLNRFEDALYHITNEFTLLWEKLFTQMPWELSLMTLDMLPPDHPTLSAKSESPHLHYIKDPLQVLNIDSRIFRYPPLVRIVLKVVYCVAWFNSSRC